MTRLIFTTFLFLSLTLQGQTKKQKDRNAIKQLCGCYEVQFNFAETFNYSTDSSYVASPNKVAYALEWVDLTYEDQNNFILQHILQIGNDSNAYIMKHWREDWIYQNKEILNYQYNNTWNKNTLHFNDVRGQWTQKVFQVDDSPRYEGSASWVHIDDKSFWENIVDAPLPRRERTIRDDYNVLKRNNRIEITDFGWEHKQDNLKIIRSSDLNDVVLAREFGFNSYRKVDDEICKYARLWWIENSSKWQIVRGVWDNVFEKNTVIQLKKSSNDKKLWELLFSDDYQKNDEIRTIIESFIMN